MTCIAAWAAACSPSQAGTTLIHGAGGNFSILVKSHDEMRWETVVRQQFDYSCGSAAVATLLTFHYDKPTDEKEVFEAMFQMGDQQRIRTVGFSMLDMKRFLDKKGLRSDGVRMTLDQFEEVGVPGITLINMKTNTTNYKHFVVIKGIEGHRVLIGDPALGTRVVPRKDLEGFWTGIVLVAREAMQTAQRHFNQEREWRVGPKAPLTDAMSRSGLGTFFLTLPGSREFAR